MRRGKGGERRGRGVMGGFDGHVMLFNIFVVERDKKDDAEVEVAYDGPVGNCVISLPGR